jgi:Lipase (class 3)
VVLAQQGISACRKRVLATLRGLLDSYGKGRTPRILITGQPTFRDARVVRSFDMLACPPICCHTARLCKVPFTPAGHSLGGALSILAAYDIQTEFALPIRQVCKALNDCCSEWLQSQQALPHLAACLLLILQRQ